MHFRVSLLALCLLTVSGCGDCSSTSGNGPDSPAPLPLLAKSWGAAQQLSAPIVTPGSYTPVVATDSEGNALAVWTDAENVFNGLSTISVSRSVWASRFTVGSGWSLPQQLFTGSTWVIEPRVSMDPDGHAMVAATGQFGNGMQTVVIRFDPQSGWTSQELAPLGCNYIPAMTTGGNAIVYWVEYTPAFPTPVSEVWARTYDVVTGWGAEELVGPSGGWALYSSIAASPDGTAVLVWEEYDGTRTEVLSAHFNGDSWIGPLAMDPPDGYNAGNTGTYLGPPAAMDAQGNGLTVWLQEEEAYLGGQMTRAGVWARRYVSGVGWQAPVKLDTVFSTQARNPSIAMSDDGSAIVTWDEPDSTAVNLNPTRIWTNRYTPAGGWGGPVPHNVGMFSQSGMDAEGNVHLVYMDFTYTSNAVYSVWSMQFKNATGWGQAVEIDGTWTKAAYHSIAISAGGTVTSVWQQPLLNNSQVIGANRFD
jgi:hypothetical protein